VSALSRAALNPAWQELRPRAQVASIKWWTSHSHGQGRPRLRADGRPGEVCSRCAAFRSGDLSKYRVDEKGEPLSGERKYVLHFEAGKLPSVSVFWNMAIHASGMLFVENEFGRYSGLQGRNTMLIPSAAGFSSL
jgi:Protein of unknown function (DUF1214)